MAKTKIAVRPKIMNAKTIQPIHQPTGETMNEKAQDLQPVNPKRSLLVAMAGKYSMDPTDFKNTIKATVMPSGATNEQMAAFLLVANQYELNPVTKEIHAFPAQGGGVTPVVGIDGWINLAQRRPEFDGMEFVFGNDESGKVESCTCSVYRKDRSRPIVVTEYMEECARQTAPWKSHPRRMLRHKTAIQAIRYAFGFSGIKDEDDAEVIYANATLIENEPSQASAEIMGAARKISDKPEPKTEPEPEPAESAPEWPKLRNGVWHEIRGIAFIPQIHGMSAGGIPAVSRAGHFCKRRGCDPALYKRMEADALALAHGSKSAAHDDTDHGHPVSDADDTDAGQHVAATAATANHHGQPVAEDTKDAPDVSQVAQEGDVVITSFEVGYPEVRTAISRAATLDACNDASDLLREFHGPDDQAKELETLLLDRHKRISALMDQ